MASFALTPRVAGLILAVCVITMFPSLGSSRALAQSKPEQELMQIENDWCTAELKQDAAWFGRILASDFTLVMSQGTTDTKESLISQFKSKTSMSTACANSNMKARVFGDAAVVTGTVTSSGTRKGVAFKDEQSLFTDTFVRREGRWQYVASHSTYVASQQK